jgi:2-C-methyl-D-erythritol 2,4-cyclodiphosphate synthase
MTKCLSDVLKIDAHQVSVKATTTEKLGFVGDGQGISAYAVVLLQLS